jgi:hypothetical protein
MLPRLRDGFTLAYKTDMSDATNPSLDPLAAARCMGLQREASPWLNEEIAQRMHSRLKWMTQPPKRWAHWLPRWGGMHSHGALKDKWAQKRSNFFKRGGGSNTATSILASSSLDQAARLRCAVASYRPAA